MIYSFFVLSKCAHTTILVEEFLTTAAYQVFFLQSADCINREKNFFDNISFFFQTNIMSTDSIQPAHFDVANICAIAPALLFALAPSLLCASALTAVGFATGGVAYGSAAASWMSLIGNVPPGSLFAFLQSAGTLGATGIALSPPFLAMESTIFATVFHELKTQNFPVATDSFIESTRSCTENLIKKASNHLSEMRTEENLENFAKYTSETSKAVVAGAEDTLNAIKDQLKTLIKDHEIIDATRKNVEHHITILVENARNQAEIAIEVANSHLSAINTPENVDLLRQHAENARVSVQHVAEVVSLNSKALLNQENVDLLRKNVEDATTDFVKNAKVAINAVSSQLNSAETQEKIDVLKRNTEEAAHAFFDNARASTENAIKAIHNQENVDLIREHAMEAADKAGRAIGFFVNDLKRGLFKKHD